MRINGANHFDILYPLADPAKPLGNHLLRQTGLDQAGLPDRGDSAQAAQIRSDLARLNPLTNSIRLYSSTGGVEMVPAIAAERGLSV